MKKGYELGGKYAHDPIGSDQPRGKNREQRKSAHDGPSWTPTEQHIKNGLMRQFMRTGEGGGMGNSNAYRESPLWCRQCFGRRMVAEGKTMCEKCVQEQQALVDEILTKRRSDAAHAYVESLCEAASGKECDHD